MNGLSWIKKNRWIFTAYGVCAIAALVPLWTVKYLPMADLPQHAAQISIIKNLNNPLFGFKEQFELHWFTPYLLPTLLALLPSYLVGVSAAVKIAISLYVLFLPITLYWLFSETKGDPWWGLIGFPLSYGFCFYWGFLIYLIAIPVGIIYLTLGIRFKNSPTLGRSVALFAAGLILFFCHGIVYAIANIILVWLLRKSSRSWPLLAQLPLVIVWVVVNHLLYFEINIPIEWRFDPWGRLLKWPYYFLGGPADGWALWGMMMLCAALFLGVAFPKNNERKWWVVWPFLLYTVAPFQMFGIYYLYPRVAIFALVVGLMSLAPTASYRRRTASRAGLVLFTVFWMMFVFSRFRLFNVDAADFDTAVKDIPANSSVLDLSLNKDSYFSKSAFSHFSAWIQAERGGVLGYSFAYHYNMVARYRHRKEPLSYWAGTRIHWDPAMARIYNTRPFDFFIVRSFFDPSDEIAAAVPTPKRLMTHVGMWWVYQRVN